MKKEEILAEIRDIKIWGALNTLFFAAGLLIGLLDIAFYRNYVLATTWLFLVFASVGCFMFQASSTAFKVAKFLIERSE